MCRYHMTDKMRIRNLWEDNRTGEATGAGEQEGIDKKMLDYAFGVHNKKILACYQDVIEL